MRREHPFEDELIAYLDGTSDEDLTWRVEKHLRRCRRCRNACRQLKLDWDDTSLWEL